MSRVIQLRNLYMMGYRDAMAVQKAVESRLLGDQTSKRSRENPVLDTLLLVEHPPVYTVGIRTAAYTDEEEDRLRRLGADFCQADRGGLITFHGPGQLVAYPVLDLNRFHKNIKWYVRALERTLIDTCLKLGVTAETCIHTGVWVGQDKIGAIGIHAKNFVTTHGVALNCNIDLGWYKHIVPCGIARRGVTSLSRELGCDVSVGKAIPKFVEAFEENFDCVTIAQEPISSSSIEEDTTFIRR